MITTRESARIASMIEAMPASPALLAGASRRATDHAVLAAEAIVGLVGVRRIDDPVAVDDELVLVLSGGEVVAAGPRTVDALGERDRRRRGAGPGHEAAGQRDRGRQAVTLEAELPRASGRRSIRTRIRHDHGRIGGRRVVAVIAAALAVTGRTACR